MSTIRPAVLILLAVLALLAIPPVFVFAVGRLAGWIQSGSLFGPGFLSSWALVDVAWWTPVALVAAVLMRATREPDAPPEDEFAG